MEKEYKTMVLVPELKHITDQELLKAVANYFEHVVPDYFWVIPASSTGKYHPDQDAGVGGLVRHSRMITEVAIALMNLEMWSSLKPYEDEIYVACLIHDTWKLGDGVTKYVEGKTYSKFEHPVVASRKFYEYIQNYPEVTDKMKKQCLTICQCVETHMGQWNTNKHSRVVLKKPATPVQKFVHMCDFIAAKNFIGNLDKIE